MSYNKQQQQQQQQQNSGGDNQEDNPINTEWIKSENGIPKEAVKWAEKFGSYLAKDDDQLKKLSTSQLRKFFGQLKRLQSVGLSKENISELSMLLAHLAYANGKDKDKKEGREKENKSKIKYFVKEISDAIEVIDINGKDIDDEKIKIIKKQFKNLVNIVEAIVAFHKAAGGE
jgi:CRISPR type III-A-associated protein Csm2